MRFDCHVHTRTKTRYGDFKHFDTDTFLRDLEAGGMGGAAIYSLSSFRYPELTTEERLASALDICRGHDTLFPFYWIEPMDEDALEQVDRAAAMGYAAFKMIPYRYHPTCQRSLDVIERIAKTGKPIMFHSGICWDGLYSSENHRPANYEALIEIPKLRFCLAHISWPWYDECIAVWGKLNHAHAQNPDKCEMFIDVTPGTPKVYREHVFNLLLGSGNLRRSLMFGTDCNTGGYGSEKALEWQALDDALYERFVVRDVEDFKDHVYRRNLLRFLGMNESSFR